MYDDESINGMLRQNLELAQENNRMLKAMRRDAMIGGVVKVLVFVLVLWASYYFTMQYLEPMMGMFESANGGINFEDVQRAFEDYRSQFESQ